jgi:hypothetical protein
MWSSPVVRAPQPVLGRVVRVVCRGVCALLTPRVRAPSALPLPRPCRRRVRPRQGRHRQQHRRAAQGVRPACELHQDWCVGVCVDCTETCGLQPSLVLRRTRLPPCPPPPGCADPYINMDAGTMSPFEHGEVFVLDDGGEVRGGWLLKRLARLKPRERGLGAVCAVCEPLPRGATPRGPTHALRPWSPCCCV